MFNVDKWLITQYYIHINKHRENNILKRKFPKKKYILKRKKSSIENAVFFIGEEGFGHLALQMLSSTN